MSRTILMCLILCLGWEASGKNFAIDTNEVSDYFLSTNINLIFDIFLKHYTKKLVEEGKTQIEVGDFERRFSTRVLAMDIEGAIEVDNGWCSNISSIYRTGDADMKVEGGVIVLSAHLGMSDPRIDYNNYDVSLLGVHQKGKIHVRIGFNSFMLKLNVQVKPTCLVSLSAIKIEQLDMIEVDITNLGVFENLTDEITSWVVDEVTKEFRSKIENFVYPEISNAVKKADICHYIHF